MVDVPAPPSPGTPWPMPPIPIGPPPIPIGPPPAPLASSPAASEGGEDLVRCPAGAVDPVVERHDPLVVVVAGVARVVDDEDAVEPSVELHAGVRVVEVRPRVGGGELVRGTVRRPAIGAWVIPGTPSMSLRRATPCQCTLVSAGRRLSTATLSRSPAVVRSRGPGTESPYPQVSTTIPPRSTVEARGVRWATTVRCPAGRRAASSRRTRSDAGPTAEPEEPHADTPATDNAPLPSRAAARVE